MSMDPMAAIKQTFFQECKEQLGELETGLLAMQGGDSDPETVNAVFRAVHSIKGGAGPSTFPRGEMVYTHQPNHDRPCACGTLGKRATPHAGRQGHTAPSHAHRLALSCGKSL